jgi:hypothetical protein
MVGPGSGFLNLASAYDFLAAAVEQMESDKVSLL